MRRGINLLFFDKWSLLLQTVGAWFIVLTSTIVFVLAALYFESRVTTPSAVIVLAFFVALMYLTAAYVVLLACAMVLAARRAYVVAREGIDELIGRAGAQIRALKAELDTLNEIDDSIAVKRKELSDLEAAFEELFEVRQRIDVGYVEFQRHSRRADPFAVAARLQQQLRDVARHRDRIDHLQPQA